MKKILIFGIVVIIAGYYLLRQVTIIDYLDPKVVTPFPITNTSDWQILESKELSYELKYPNDWGFFKQGDGLIDFGPGTISPAAGKILLDMMCLYGTSSNIYGERTTSTIQQVVYGSNEFIEKKIYVVNDNEKRLSFHNLTISLPSWYEGNSCKTASFIIREEVDEEILAGVLSTFKLKEAR